MIDLPTAAAIELERRRRTAIKREQTTATPEWYQRDPIAWARDYLGIPEHTLRWSLLPEYAEHAWDGTPDPLAAVCEALASGQSVGVESGTGTGKTFCGAFLVTWFLCCFKDSITVTTAPKEDQLSLHIWKEIGAMYPRLKQKYPQLTRAHLRLRMTPPGLSDEESEALREKWSAVGYACGIDAETSAQGEQGSATKAQGFHAEHMLIMTEETPGIHPAVMTAFENTRTGDHNLHVAWGNPDHTMDALHLFCLKPEVQHVRISALDHPNVVTRRTIIPGAVSYGRVEARRIEYGEDSRLYQSRVQGICPSEAAEALIRMAWIRQCIAREAPPEGLPALGVDVANSERGDKAAVAHGYGSCCTEVRAFQCPDANVLGADVFALMQTEKVNRSHVGVDSVGVGVGTFNKLKELGELVQGLNGGMAPDEFVVEEEGDRVYVEEEKFNNLRSQMWWQARKDAQFCRVTIPDDPELHRDLVVPKWKTHNGKIVVESKEDIKKRLGRSPNKGDAFVYWNWVRRRRPLPPQEPDPQVVLSNIQGHTIGEIRKAQDRRKVQLRRQLGML